MAISTSDLVDAFVPEELDLERIGLEGVSLPILGHLGNDLVAIS